MKLSNKILIAFFGFIFLYMTAAFTELRVRGVSSQMDDKNSKVETVKINEVRRLVVSDLEEKVYITSSDTARLEVRSIDGDLMSKLDYTIEGETLTLRNLDIDEDQSIRISIYIPARVLKGITSNGALLTVSGLETDSLEIAQQDGWLFMTERNRIGSLDLTASDGYVDLRNSAIDTLHLRLRQSEFRMNDPVRYLEGEMSDGSSLRMFGIEQIHLKKDSTSRIYIE